MKTWYEKCYGEPPPVNTKKVNDNPLPRLLKEETKKQKEAAWYKAEEDYIQYLRSKNEKT